MVPSLSLRDTHVMLCRLYAHNPVHHPEHLMDILRIDMTSDILRIVMTGILRSTSRSQHCGESDQNTVPRVFPLLLQCMGTYRDMRQQREIHAYDYLRYLNMTTFTGTYPWIHFGWSILRWVVLSCQILSIILST